MTLNELLHQLASCGLPAPHEDYLESLHTMTPAQRELVAVIAHAAYANGELNAALDLGRDA